MGENWVHHLGSAVTFEGKERGVSGTWGLGRLAGDVGVGKNDVMHQTTIFGFRNRGIRRDSVVYGVRLRSRGARET